VTADVRYDTVLRCDGPGCTARYTVEDHWSVARKRAAELGWSTARLFLGETFDRPTLRDFCPVHAP